MGDRGYMSEYVSWSYSKFFSTNRDLKALFVSLMPIGNQPVFDHRYAIERNATYIDPEKSGVHRCIHNVNSRGS